MPPEVSAPKHSSGQKKASLLARIEQIDVKIARTESKLAAMTEKIADISEGSVGDDKIAINATVGMEEVSAVPVARFLTFQESVDLAENVCAENSSGPTARAKLTNCAMRLLLRQVLIVMK